MIRFFFIYIFSCTSIILVHSQKYSISGIVKDEHSNPMTGVYVELNQVATQRKSTEMTDSNGKYIFPNLESGEYLIKIKLIGYEHKELAINVTTSDVRIDPINLEISSKNLSEIVINEKKPIAKLINDTIQYDANSFKVLKDATADELVDKIPSMTRDQGVLKSQGEEIKQVLIDGKPFFGNDPNLSLKNLPAELIDKVQIFDQQSEQSQFTGINDGNTIKTINIVTKAGMNNGQFGKLYFGYGDEEKYQLGGNFNYFDGDRRISLIGISNNINIQNFSIDDILGAIGSGQGTRSRVDNRGGPSRSGYDSRRDGRGGSSGPGDFLVSSNNGITKTHAIGLNISDKLGSKFEYTISYFFNQTNNFVDNELNRNYYNDTFQHVYSEINHSNPFNTNHRLNGRFEYKIDSFNSILFRPRVTYQSNNSHFESEFKTVQRYIINNVSNSATESDGKGFNTSNNLLYRHKFIKPGRTISLDLNSNFAPRDEKFYQSSFSEYLSGSQTIYDTILQRQFKDYSKWSMSSNLEYTEPISLQSSLSANYRYSFGNDQSKFETFDILNEPGNMEVLNSSLSNDFKTFNRSHQTGLSYQYNKPQVWNINIRFNWQISSLEKEQFFPNSLKLSKNYYAILPSLFARYSITKSKNFHLFYRTNTQLPTVTQLQNVLDNSNPVQLKIGNPELEQAITHNFNIRYTANNSNATILYLMAGGSFTSNSITNQLYLTNRNHPAFVTYNIFNGVQLIVPVNSKTTKQFRSFASYTIPLTKIKCNLSLDGSYIYSENPALIDDLLYYSYQNNFSFGFSLTSNINDKVDFTIQFRPSYNTYNSSDLINNYFLFDQRLKFNWLFGKKNIVRLEFNSRFNEDLSTGFNENIYLLNLVAGRKLFKNERGEISLGINDIFNQNKNIQRNISEYYIEDNISNIIQRFFMLSFTYNIRHFNSGKKSQPGEPREFDRGHWR